MTEACHQCGHPFNPHAMLALTGDPMDGGIVLCPVVECKCYATWSAGGKEKPLVALTEDELRELRTAVQTGAT